MQLELVTEGLQFSDGRIAMADGSVVLVEIRRQTLTRVRPKGEQEIIAALGGGPIGARSAARASSSTSTPHPERGRLPLALGAESVRA